MASISTGNANPSPHKRLGQLCLRPLSLALLLGLAFCAKERTLPGIGENIAGPIDVALSRDEASGQEFFFVLNADLNHVYDSGSILLVDREGSRRKAFKIPRLGRSLQIAGQRLLVTYDENSGQKADSKVELYAIAYEAGADFPRLSLKKSWDFKDCRALNAVMRPGYPYFAVACESGQLLVGTFNDDDLSQSILVKARHYPRFVRRAMHIDTQRHFLYAFVTDMNRPNLSDAYLPDRQTFNPSSKALEGLEGGDDTPDEQQKDRPHRVHLADEGSPYQFALYAFKDPANWDGEQPKFRDYKEIQADEMRWMYFTLKGADGKEERASLKKADEEKAKDDASREKLHAEYKYYRTNFWKAMPDLDPKRNSDDRRFYLSHRGDKHSPHANNLLLVSLKPEIQSYEDLKTHKYTKDLFTIERVYGFQHGEEQADEDYLGDFALTTIHDENVLLVNHFRSQSDFDQPFFMLRASKTGRSSTGEGQSQEVIFAHKAFTSTPKSKHPKKGAYYQFAVTSPLGEGESAYVHVLASSFFDDSLRLFRLNTQELVEIAKFK